MEAVAEGDPGRWSAGIRAGMVLVHRIPEEAPTHGHRLVTMYAREKVKDEHDVDARVCAEFPPEGRTTQRGLDEIVSGGMVPGPCGTRNPRHRCNGSSRNMSIMREMCVPAV